MCFIGGLLFCEQSDIISIREVLLVMLSRLVSSLYQVDSLAAHFNIIDKPNERSSHSSIVLRGGGIIFLFGVWLWCVLFGFHYPLFLAAVTLAAGISFIDDIHSLPDSGKRLLLQPIDF